MTCEIGGFGLGVRGEMENDMIPWSARLPLPL